MRRRESGPIARVPNGEAGDSRIVVICGSSGFVDIMAVCAWLIERDEKAMVMGLHLLPGWYGDVPHHLAEAEGYADQMDALHLRKIDYAREIFVVDFRHYIGESTTREIEHAKEAGKTIRYFSKDPIGEAVIRIMQKSVPDIVLCRKCGCSEDYACAPNGCSWVEPDLCSVCEEEVR